MRRPPGGHGVRKGPPFWCSRTRRFCPWAQGNSSTTITPASRPHMPYHRQAKSSRSRTTRAARPTTRATAMLKPGRRDAPQPGAEPHSHAPKPNCWILRATATLTTKTTSTSTNHLATSGVILKCLVPWHEHLCHSYTQTARCRRPREKTVQVQECVVSHARGNQTGAFFYRVSITAPVGRQGIEDLTLPCTPLNQTQTVYNTSYTTKLQVWKASRLRFMDTSNSVKARSLR